MQGLLRPLPLPALSRTLHLFFPPVWWLQQTNKSYKGVRFNKDRRQWQAYILDDDQVHWLGFYDNEDDAARAHDAEALRRCEGGGAWPWLG